MAHSGYRWARWARFGAVAALLCGSLPAAEALTINVSPPPGATGAVNGFRYVIEEDRTYDVIPGCSGLAPITPECAAKGATVDTLSLKFHRSYMPVVASGQVDAGAVAIDATPLDLNKRYFVSVLPLADTTTGAPAFAMSAAPIRPGQTTVNVTVDVLPLKTAQISIFLYNDDSPINNQADAPNAQERGLCGFELHLYDAGGTYGASGGRISTDTFGNPLGTTYNPVTNEPTIASGVLKTDRNGVLRIKNLAPAKYTGFALPPQQAPSAAECPLVVGGSNIGLYGPNKAAGQIAWGEWHQTSTIEGTWGIDAWVKAGEPSYFKEFGPPGHHINMGFVKRFATVGPGTGTSSVAGRVVNTHMSRPPAVAFYNGKVEDKCWIGLNEVAAGTGGGVGVYANPCNPDGTFKIEGLKAGTRYQLAVWDTPLDNVFALYDFVTPAAGGAVALNDVPVFRWFGAFEGKICHDQSNDGVCDANEPGIPGQAFNLRFRDGSVYQSAATNDAGEYELVEVFPFFNWMVAEVDFARFKATGATFMVDAGGPVDTLDPLSRGKLTPQVQPDGTKTRTEVGAVLTQGTQTFLGTTNVIDFGKAPYRGNENGGISGIVRYNSTRAEWDPRLATGENNEPGIPGVTVNLYRADPANKKLVAVGSTPIAVAVTDSWDDSAPAGCVGPVFTTADGVALDCYDGLRNYNQMRPGVFDGGYAFVQFCANGWGAGPSDAGVCPNGEAVADLVPGNYIVEVVPPVGYEIQKEEDKNVDFGEFYSVATQALPPECVGTRPIAVPAELDLFPGVAIPAEYRDVPATATTPAKLRPYCDRKAVTLIPQLNAAADFSLFTKVPVAGHIVGMILDDLANEFSPFSPNFGEKFAPPFMPVSLRDQGGREFSRVYSDRYGTYNALVPSTFAYNIPMPSGVSPNMIQACLNTPYTIDPLTNLPKLDPHFNKSYTQFCYTFQYLPGKTTYLDTPVLPIAAFAGPQQYALDCEAPTLTPAIAAVYSGIDTNPATGSGPWVAAAGATLTVTSLGETQVLNPLYNNDNPGAGVPRLVTRNYGFGTTAGTVTINGVAATVTNWTDAAITLTVPSTTTGTLLVTAANGNTTARGVTVHIGGNAPVATVRSGQKIQAAIDSAPEGALITVAPGVYEEAVIVNKRVRVQGYGAGSTLINAVKQPTEKLAQWRQKVCELVTAAGGNAYLLPGQAQPATLQACLTGDTADNAPLLFGDHEGPGFFVMVKDTATPDAAALQIDGFTVSGADQGGGVTVNGYARKLQISNNRITANQGIEAGGIQVGHANLLVNGVYTDGRNTDVNIHHNEIVQNGNTAGDVGGAGGGIGLFTGSDRYRVSSNFVCGNYSSGDGGGIGHQGLSFDGVIENNRIMWNQAFHQMSTPNGGGISITGDRSLVAANGLSTGSGSVKILNNLLQGNHAGAGDGGAISLNGINGSDAATAPYSIDLFNNVIVDNVAGLAGGGIALQDAIKVQIINNTIAHNDSTATGSRAFTVAPNTPGLTISTSNPQPGVGIAARGHSAALNTALGLAAGSGYSNPRLVNTLLVDNRMYHWRIDYTQDPLNCQLSATPGAATNTCYGLVYDGVSDIAVLGAGGTLNPQTSALTNVPVNAGYLGLNLNVAVTSSLDPATGLLRTTLPLSNAAFLAEYVNGGRDAVIQQPEAQVSNVSTAVALDEGGNFIDTRFGPLTPLRANGTPFGDYRIAAGSFVAGKGSAMVSIADLLKDAAGVDRGVSWDIGAYEVP